MVRQQNDWVFSVEDLPHITVPTPEPKAATLDHQGGSFRVVRNGVGRFSLKMNANNNRLVPLLKPAQGSMIVARQRGVKRFGFFLRRKITDKGSPETVELQGPSLDDALYRSEIEPFSGTVTDWDYQTTPVKAGVILNDQFARATTRGSLVWLAHSYTATLDSNGDPWDIDLSLEVTAGRTIGNLLDELAKLDYEWSVTWDDSGGAWTLDVYNPGGMGTDHVAATPPGNPTILEGRDITGGNITQQQPIATAVRAYGADGLTVVVTAPVPIGNFDRLERVVRNTNIDDAGTLTKFAQSQLDARLSVEPTQWEVSGVTQSIPFIHYGLGDNMWTTSDGGQVARRVFGVTVDVQARTGYTVEMDGPVADEQTAKAEGLRRLLSAIKEYAPAGFGGIPDAGAPQIIVASADAPPKWADAADFTCDNVADQVQIQDALNLAASVGTNGGTVLLSPGTFTLDGKLAFPSEPVYLVGDGMAPLSSSTGSTKLTWTSTTATFSGIAVTLSGRGGLQNMTMAFNNGAASSKHTYGVASPTGGLTRIDGVAISGIGITVAVVQTKGEGAVTNSYFHAQVVGASCIEVRGTRMQYTNLRLNASGRAVHFATPLALITHDWNVFNGIIIEGGSSTTYLIDINDHADNKANLFSNIAITATSGAFPLAVFRFAGASTGQQFVNWSSIAYTGTRPMLESPSATPLKALRAPSHDATTRPAASAVPGEIIWYSPDSKLQRSNGTTWEVIGP